MNQVSKKMEKEDTDDDGKCNGCGRIIPFYVTRCQYCQLDVGFPNIRMAKSPAEVKALDLRYKLARDDAAQVGVSAILEGFEKEVSESSSAVICRGVADISIMLTPNRIYRSFRNGITSGARVAEDNKFDALRGSVDELMFPLYSDEISFASLALNNTGCHYFGDFSVRIRADAISTRTSLFHEDSFTFITSRQIGAGSEVPAGYRCTWEARGTLAVAKLAHKFTNKTISDDFAAILLSQPDDEAEMEPNYIEVHIYGGVLADAFESVSCNSHMEEDTLIVKKIVRDANSKGIQVELISI